MCNLRRIKIWAAIILTSCFLFVTAGLSYNPEIHLHLGHHDRQSHGTTWCSWTCQAGNALEGFSLLLPQLISRLLTTDVTQPKKPDLVLYLHSSSRAPPSVAKAS